MTAVMLGLIGCGGSSGEAPPLASGNPPEALPLSGPPGEGEPGIVAEYAWQAFVAMTWPAAAENPGVPLQPDNLAEYGVYPPGVLPKFMTWKRDVDLFPNLGGESLAWNAPPSASSCGEIPDPGFVVDRVAKGDDLDIGTIVQAGSLSPLIDQESRYVYYSVHYDQTFYDYIHANGYYDMKNWPAEGLSFPAGQPGSPPSTMTKFSWRDVRGLPPEATENFFVQEGHVLDPASCGAGRQNCDCEPATFALVGAHLVTKLEGYSQWIWATFEHHGNLDSWKGQPPSFQSTPPAPNPSSHPAFNYQPTTFPLPDPEPVNVVRVVPVPSYAEAANLLFSSTVAAGTIWENYFLSAMQYPRNERALPEPNILGVGCRLQPDQSFTANLAGGDFFPACQVANPTMETYIPNSSCSSCHESARQTRADYSFSTAFNAALASGGQNAPE